MKRRTPDVSFGQVWPTLAESQGWKFTPADNGSGTIRGQYEDFPILIPPRSRFRRPGSYLQIELTVSNPQDCYFKLSSGFRSSILKRYDAKSLAVGDKTFDRQFLLSGDPEPLIQQCFKSVVLRQKLLKARWMGSLEIKLFEQTLTFLLKDQGMANVRHMESYLEALARLARVIEALKPLV